MMAYDLVGSVSWPVFIFVTLVLFGWVAVMAATALRSHLEDRFRKSCATIRVAALVPRWMLAVSHPIA